MLYMHTYGKYTYIHMYVLVVCTLYLRMSYIHNHAHMHVCNMYICTYIHVRTRIVTYTLCKYIYNYIEPTTVTSTTLAPNARVRATVRRTSTGLVTHNAISL